MEKSISHSGTSIRVTQDGSSESAILVKSVTLININRRHIFGKSAML